jgi:hypothetical protein
VGGKEAHGFAQALFGVLRCRGLGFLTFGELFKMIRQVLISLVQARLSALPHQVLM